jgi:hypothetical protein
LTNREREEQEPEDHLDGAAAVGAVGLVTTLALSNRA